MQLPPCLALDRSGFETACRAASRAVYMGNQALLCRVLTRYLMFVDAGDLGLTPHICFDGFWEAWISLAMARLLRAGSFCLDIGANHGYYSLILGEAARMGGRLQACEPNPRLAALLQDTLQVNGMDGWCRVIDKAVADVSGRAALLSFSAHSPLNGSICLAASKNEHSVAVETVTVDEMTAAWPRVDFIKIDAEGAEEMIWRGMQNSIRRSPGICIVMEFRADRYRDPNAFLAAIQESGLALQFIDYDTAIKPFDRARVLANPSEDVMLCLRRE